MELVVRVVAVYLFVMLLVRISGKRMLREITVFDFVLLLILSEAVQQGMVGDDFSLTTALLAVAIFVAVDVVFSVLKHRFRHLDRVIDGLPVVIVENGELLEERTALSRVDESEIMEAARELHGLERLEQVKYAVLERSGVISIIPQEGAGG